jgi:hypothetical protein
MNEPPLLPMPDGGLTCGSGTPALRRTVTSVTPYKGV